MTRLDSSGRIPRRDHVGTYDEAGFSQESQQPWRKNDDVEGLTNLIQECHSLRAQNAMLEDRCKRLSQERSQTVRDIEEAAARYHALDQELETRTDQLRIATERLTQLEYDFRTATDDLDKARKTITIQSRAIQGHRDTATVRPTSNQVVVHQPPPVNNRFGIDCGFGFKAVSTAAPDPRESLYAPSQYEDQAPSGASR
ncbi:MAG: hypothetical protein Q9220_000934 [cf. Caloplaca sp. 1 TL-2023]